MSFYLPPAISTSFRFRCASVGGSYWKRVSAEVVALIRYLRTAKQVVEKQ